MTHWLVLEESLDDLRSVGDEVLEVLVNGVDCHDGIATDLMSRWWCTAS